MNRVNLDRAIITIATGKEIYLELAINLARSFKLWHKNSSLKFYLATDRKDLIPQDLCDIHIIELTPEQTNKGFCSKLYLDKLAPAKENLFIDADCLCYGNLEFIFDRFKNYSVSAIGDTITQGEFFCNVDSICQKLNLKYLPRFVGSLYYLQKDETCNKVFNKARELKEQYDRLGLVRLRGKENEEPLISIAMSIYNQNTILDNGDIKADMMSFQEGIKLDILTGVAYLWNKKNKPFPTWLNLLESRPKIIHFNDTYVESIDYQIEVIKLEKFLIKDWSQTKISIYTFLIIYLPNIFYINFKNLFRPLYRKLFGYRNILKSNRV